MIAQTMTSYGESYVVGNPAIAFGSHPLKPLHVHVVGSESITQPVSGTVTTQTSGRLMVPWVPPHSTSLEVHLVEPIRCTVEQPPAQGSQRDRGWAFDAPSAWGGAIAAALFFAMTVRWAKGALR